MNDSAEAAGLNECRTAAVRWKRWGPYLSERQWGTVRDDCSNNGNACDYFTHDHVRSRACRWEEDGLLGISDNRQLLCFAPAPWNGRDPTLKERLFALTSSEGNHGEESRVDCLPAASNSGMYGGNSIWRGPNCFR
jgi:hypothetical protein